MATRRNSKAESAKPAGAASVHDAALDTLKVYVRAYYDVQYTRLQVEGRERALGMTEGRSGALLILERGFLRDVKKAVEATDIGPWLLDVKGIGPALAGVLISELRDPARFDTVSKVWAYSGLHVKDGAAVKKKKGQKANWNGFLKSKLFLMAESFVKCRSPYRDFYDNMKHRIASRTTGPPKKYASTAGSTILPNGYKAKHVDMMAKRYCAKMFLIDFYKEWRTMRGLPVRPPYAEEYIGKTHAE